ncbi:MarR family transcriptional regulator [Pseudonocardia halophobica]|uniref:MarR family transcriptional regulator n=1 Tax=Pseudonocardia halophobica TaxID=29401 RepID=A0A9W6L0P5_9PSEU|nr:MarR family transcriptional regulator [Pseudonocardia halophobica]
MLLEDQLCFAIYAASRAVTAAYRPLLDELGLTYPQYLVMLLLWKHGSLTVKEVATALHLDYGTVTPLLKRLQGAGLIARRRRTDDERGVEAVLTDEGRDLQARALGVPVGMAEAFGLEADERDALRDRLHALVESMDAYAGAGRSS